MTDHRVSEVGCGLLVVGENEVDCSKKAILVPPERLR